MPRERDELLSRVKAIEREFSALRLAVARLLAHAASDPNVIATNGVALRDVDNASARLEGTYLIRL